MEKEREVERRVEPPPAERDDVRVAGTRCPYCHEDVARETADVCRDCLARHHGGCWTEGQRCGACGSAHVLRPVLPPLTPARLRELFGAALRREGYPDAEIERVLPPPPDRCSTPGCLERGVAQGTIAPLLHCPAHAAAQRRALLTVGLVLLASGVASLLAFAVAASVQHDGNLLGVGVLLLALLGPLGGLMIRQVRSLPPIPPTTLGKGA